MVEIFWAIYFVVVTLVLLGAPLYALGVHAWARPLRFWFEKHAPSIDPLWLQIVLVALMAPPWMLFLTVVSPADTMLRSPFVLLILATFTGLAFGILRWHSFRAAREIFLVCCAILFIYLCLGIARGAVDQPYFLRANVFGAMALIMFGVSIQMGVAIHTRLASHRARRVGEKLRREFEAFVDRALFASGMPT